MGVLEWVEGMRKKPVREKQRFVAGSTVAIMAGITAIWFFFFFAHFFHQLNEQKSALLQAATSTLPAASIESITPPFSQP